MKLNELTAHEIRALIQAKKTSGAEVLQAVHDQIQRSDKDVRAYVRLFPGMEQTPLSGGVPIAIKDNICVAGQELTCASRILKGFVPPYDAAVVKRLKAAGSVFIGHANMDEFAFGSSTENSCYGPTRNPWDLSRVPGGSSGGSAAAVASQETIWALGSDTGGSIRQPAAFCGVVGLKPTYGLVSRYGLVAFASSLDQIGPITKDVTDAAWLLNIIAGHDNMDSTSANLPKEDYTEALVNDVRGIRIGIPKEYFVDGLDPQVKDAVMAARKVLERQGAVFEEVSLPHTEYAIAAYYIVATAEASSNLARFDGVQYGLRRQPAQPRRTALVDMYEETRDAGFGAEAKRRIMLGTYALSSGYYDDYYLRGLKTRTLIKGDFDDVFKKCDAILAPTAPTTAFKIGEKVDDPLAMYLSDIYTISANLAGIPALSLPCGFSNEGLPVGLQIMGRSFAEKMILRIAFTFEQNTEWHKRRPGL